MPTQGAAAAARYPERLLAIHRLRIEVGKPDSVPLEQALVPDQEPVAVGSQPAWTVAVPWASGNGAPDGLGARSLRRPRPTWW